MNLKELWQTVLGEVELSISKASLLLGLKVLKSTLKKMELLP